MLFDSYDSAKRALDAFIQKNRRKSISFDNTIGGSEMASIDDKSRYGSFQSVVGSKLKLKEYIFNGNRYTRWGNLFEPVSRKLLETIYNCTTIQSPSLYGFCEWSRYTPDDFFIYRLEIDGKIIYVILLVEYKSPFSRVPGDCIPDEYQHQINTGLASIPIAHSALFFDSQFKVCKLSDLEYTNKYNRQIHRHKVIKTPPIGLSFIGFYINKEKHKDKKEDIIDLGDENMDAFDKCVKYVLDKKQEIFYACPDIKKDFNYKKTVIKSFREFCEKKNSIPTHIIPVKIYSYKSILMERKKDDIDQFVTRLSGKVAHAKSIIESLSKLSYEDKYIKFVNIGVKDIITIKLSQKEIDELLCD